jgi:hypothetical protein
LDWARGPWREREGGTCLWWIRDLVSVVSSDKVEVVLGIQAIWGGLVKPARLNTWYSNYLQGALRLHGLGSPVWGFWGRGHPVAVKGLRVREPRSDWRLSSSVTYRSITPAWPCPFARAKASCEQINRRLWVYWRIY